MKVRLTSPFRRLVGKKREREHEVSDEVQDRIAALRAARDVAGADADLDEVKELASWMLGEGEEEGDEGVEEEGVEEEGEEEPEEEPEEEEEVEEEEPEPPKKRASRSRKKS